MRLQISQTARTPVHINSDALRKPTRHLFSSMPILCPDPWRQQYFNHISCPEDVSVPVKDADAYLSYREFRWAYNKLLIAEKQGLLCAPHGVVPTQFPVFSKPIYNLNNMGLDSRVLHDIADYHEHRKAGHMWSELLVGDHISTDVLVLDGIVFWHSHTRGHPLDEGTFDRWDVNVECNEDLMLYLKGFIRQHFQGFNGPMNLETIGGKIIEMHLRFTDQWPDLYPPEFMNAVVMLSSGAFSMSGEALRNRATGYSVMLFVRHGGSHWNKPSEYEIESLLHLYNISSVQLSFHEGQPAKQHSMPPGGFRLAVINGFNLEECLKAREHLAESLGKVNKFSRILSIVD
jgi:hypothetical protein